MADAVLLLFGNWLSLWDFRELRAIDLATLFIQFGFVCALYFTCALIAPDFDGGESFDMGAFHARQGPTYIGAALVLVLASVVGNLTAGAVGVANWAEENRITLIMVPTVAAALFLKNRIVQIVCPALLFVELMAYLVIYYPVLR
jgi:hypothetical protein